MLSELSIRDFAIIDDLTIPFHGGLTILSGETGAGKSIIINAVNLMLGARASADMVRTGADAAELEARFEIPPESPGARIMAENDLDPAEGLLIRRVVSRQNRHRIYINGRQATAALLGAVTENLAVISGQHAHQKLLDETEHLDILDRFGDLWPLRLQVGTSWRELGPLIREVENLKDRQRRQAELRDLLDFQRREIQEAAIRPDEDKELEAEIQRLKNAELLAGVVSGAVSALYGADGAVVERLSSVKKDLDKASRIDPALGPPLEILTDAAYRVEDAVEILRSYLTGIERDDKRLEAADERLHLLHRLKRKYGGSLASVAAHLETVLRDLEAVDHLSDLIPQAEARLRRHRDGLLALASELSRKRAEAARVLASRVEAQLADLKMANTRFSVALEPPPAGPDTNPFLQHGGGAITETGLDRARFMIAPNVGEEAKPLAAIASGGELSRVVLALKTLLTDTDTLQTVIFDEVDSGIGGAVAETVGRNIAALARRHQVICITHLPQIARFGTHHYRIEKMVSDGRTTTRIAPLAEEERVAEIARMLGGEILTPTTLAHAREMLLGPPSHPPEPNSAPVS